MSFDLVKNGIVGILKTNGFIESQEISSFENASANEYGNTFILKCPAGEMDNDRSETLNKGFDDYQKWQIQVAFEKSAQSDLANYDDVHRKKDILLRELDDPANWSTYTRIQKYKSWNVQELKSYFVLTIELKIIDTYTY
jgi:hypothetical protein